MILTITKEQEQMLQQTVLTDGRNAWEYIQSRSEDERPWIVAGIESCIKKGYPLNRLMIGWEARDVKYAEVDDRTDVLDAIMPPTTAERFRAAVSLEDRGDILAYEKGLLPESSVEIPGDSRRLAQHESDRLIAVAKRTGKFIPSEEWDAFGERCTRPSGESIVFMNEKQGIVVKAKNPFVTAFKDDSPLEVLYLHHIHNYFFNDVRYRFIGVSQDPVSGGARFILEQLFVDTVGRPTKSEIQRWFELRGFHLTGDGYWFTDGHVAFTDVWADNCLKDADGNLRFIDPMIKFIGKPRWVIDHYLTVYHRTSDDKFASRVKASVQMMTREELEKDYKAVIDYFMEYYEISTALQRRVWELEDLLKQDL